MQAAVSGKIRTIDKAAEAFGARLQPALDLLHATLTKAADVEGTPVLSRTTDLSSALSSHLGLVDDIQEALADLDVLHDHIIAIAEATAAFGWVIADDPVAHVNSAVSEVASLSSALRARPDPSHAQLADALDDFLSTLAGYVEKHPEPLEFVESSDAVSQPPSDAASINGSQNHTAPHLTDFRDTISRGAMGDFEKASAALQGVLPILAQHLAGAVQDLYDFIVAASKMQQKPSDEKRQEMLSSIITRITTIGDTVRALVPTDPLFNHAKAVEDSLAMLSWIVADEKPTSFITEAETASEFYLNKVLMSAKKSAEPGSHRNFVGSLKAIFTAMRAYIKEHHPTGLRFGIGVEGKSDSSANTSSKAPVFDAEDEHDNNYVSAFRKLIDGPLAEYIKASETIGGDLSSQASVFADAWKAKGELITIAFNAPKPDDFHNLLTPIGTKMGEVNSFAENADPRGPLTQHLMAVGESVNALGWVAVEEKATSFVADSAGTGQFYIDKVKMNAKKSDNPEVHRNWAKCLETLWSELKAYVKEYHTQSLVWNPPKRVAASSRSVRTHDDDESDSANYVTAFNELIEGPVTSFVTICDKFGGDVAKQAAILSDAWKLEAELLKMAFTSPKPKDMQSFLEPIGSKMSDVGTIAENADPKGQLINHLTAVSESISSLGWVAVDEKAAVFVADSASTGQFYIDRVKMTAKRMDNASDHRAWAQALEAMWNALRDYVKEYHTQSLVWNPPKQASNSSKRASRVSESSSSGSNYVDAFRELLNGPLAAFLTVSKKIGGDVAKQAEAFGNAWKAEEEFLKKAINMNKPNNIQDLLSPIGEKMGDVIGITEKADPRDSHNHHLLAVSESVGALGWVAVDEKATAFVGDSAGTGQFYIDKVKMSAKKTDMPDTHREWAKSLESLWSDLKAYVKEYHTQCLSWKS